MITAKVKTALIEDPQVKATHVYVDTFCGTVQISGFAASCAAIRHAERVTREMNGVTGIKNDLRVSGQN